MEVAASIVGHLAAGVRVCNVLHSAISSTIDAPLLARTLCDEVRDFGYALTKLMPYVDGSSPITLLGASTTHSDHLSLTLAGCVVTFSLLEKKIDRVITQQHSMTTMDRLRWTTMDRLRWTFAESDLTQLVNRLQQHKSTMTLLLTIWIRHCRGQLDTQLAETFPHLSDASISEDRVVPGNHLQAITETDSSSIRTVTSRLTLYRHSFESTLFTSRPYRRMTATPAMSVASSKRPGMRWSLITGGSNDSVFSLPITTFTPAGPGQTLSEISNIPGAGGGSLLTSVTERLTNQDTAFISAISERNAGRAIRALALGANINASDEMGNSALICAINSNDDRMVEILLKEGADIEQTDSNDNHALHVTVMHGYPVLCALLLDHGADIEKRDSNQNTTLHLATMHRWKEIVELLLDRGAYIEAVDGTTSTCLLLAVKGDHWDMAKLLLKRRANIESTDNGQGAALHIAIRCG
ncbi:hypothetical protein Q9L58_001891 [Maublancomyces gigas]|uniref:Ankyrin repeat protein n=1 Tax=Discina gigas TaxID=1032678 RepID=A0ABR3GT80_9PEZI